MSNIGTYAKGILAFLGAGATTGAAMMAQGVPLSWRLALAMLAAACAVGVPVTVVSNAPSSRATDDKSTPPVSLGVVPTTSSDLAPEVAMMDGQASTTVGGSSPVLTRDDASSVTPG